MDERANIKTEELTDQFNCEQCGKIFGKEADLHLHVKSKHTVEKEKEKEKEKEAPKSKFSKGQPRNRALEMQQNEHEDTIYAYLGELGEKNQENGSREDIILAEENQKQIIQTNYSFNKVVRTPYEKQIIPPEHVPTDYVESSPNREFLEVLVEELKEFQSKLEVQKEKWQFRDPMAPEEEAEDQFSLMEVRKLILNYPRRNIVAKFPHFSIFILWVGRICKPAAWKEFFIIISSYLADYYKRQKAGRPSQRWQSFYRAFEAERVKGQLLDKLAICDERTVKKLCEYFYRWTQLFDLVNEFC